MSLSPSPTSIHQSPMLTSFSILITSRLVLLCSTSFTRLSLSLLKWKSPLLNSQHMLLFLTAHTFPLTSLSSQYGLFVSIWDELSSVLFNFIADGKEHKLFKST